MTMHILRRHVACRRARFRLQRWPSAVSRPQCIFSRRWRSIERASRGASLPLLGPLIEDNTYPNAMDTTDPFPEPSGPFYPPLAPQPSASSASGNSSQATGSAASSPQHSSTSTLIFSFLIVFLAVFGGFLVGGMAWQRWTLARRRQRRAGQQRAEDARAGKARPRVWDVYVGDGSTARGSSWTEIYPLSMTLPVQRPTAPIPGAENPKSQSDSDSKLITPWRRNIWHFPADPRLDSQQALALAPQPKERAQVAVLVLMPSRYAYTPVTDDALANRAAELSCDYAIGTTLVTHDTLDPDVASPP
ncbi:hypothetical protein OBBRIDRAFT_281175 [Obba rivulosa]|uniref:Uncharacterized protein n=1 Tax=Obba rivulosa TaxID=1052685 RepID=A0A8E2APN9_9APHY|nr:hypothetical protein OBBRIDRAFT_281175 [Obba rivulosa]